MGKGDNSWIFFVVGGLLLAAVFNVGGLGDTLCSKWNVCLAGQEAAQPPASNGGGSNGGGGTSAPPCIYDGGTMTVGPMHEKWNPSTSVTGFAARVFVNGVDRGLKDDSSTLDVKHGDEIEIYYMENASATQYYTNVAKFNAPCSPSFTSAQFGDADEVFAVESSSNYLNVKVINDDDGNVNAVGANETLGSGDVTTLQFTYQPTFEDAWSPNCRGVLVVEGNATAYDKIIVNGWETAPIPNQHSLGAVTDQGWAYYVPLIPIPADGAYQKQSASLTIDVADVNPGDATDITLSWYDCDYYRHSSTGKMMTGVEDDANADVGEATFTDIIYTN